MSAVRQLAAAKINLTLKVLGRRSDGYHELESLVAFADVGDVVTLDPDAPAGVSITGPFAHSIAGANLIEVTLARLAATVPGLRLGAVHLDKRLPVAAGIGGGSADAAAVIRLARMANPSRAGDVDWNALSLAIGADVPVCLASRAAWMRGVGERIEVLDPALPRLDAVIANPLLPVPADKTAQVFRGLAATPFAVDQAPTMAPVRLVTRHDVLELVQSMGNDLMAAARAVVPAVDDVLAALRSCDGVACTSLSGGGPTCFAIMDDRHQATQAAARLRHRYPTWWVVAATLS